MRELCFLSALSQMCLSQYRGNKGNNHETKKKEPFSWNSSLGHTYGFKQPRSYILLKTIPILYHKMHNVNRIFPQIVQNF